MNRAVFLVAGLFFTCSLWAQSAEQIIADLEKKMFPNAKSVVTISLATQKGQKEEYGLVTYSKDNNQKIIVRFSSPPRQVGNDLIMLERNVWSYDQRAGREVKVPSNLSFGGTGFSYGDVVRLNFSDNYLISIKSEDSAAWLLELTAKERDAPYFRIELLVSKEMIPVRGTAFSRSGDVVKVMEYTDLRLVGGRMKPCSVTVTSPLEPGNVSVMTTVQEIPKDYPDNIFNKRNLAARLEEKY